MNFSMIAKITKITKELLNSSEGESLQSYSYNLPLFSTNLNYAYQKEYSEYVLQLWIVSHGRYPVWPQQLTMDDLKKINAYWDYCIENKKDVIEFEL